MNIIKLKEAEADSLFRYPGGFENPEMLERARKHKFGKMVNLITEEFSRRHCRILEERDLERTSISCLSVSESVRSNSYYKEAT